MPSSPSRSRSPSRSSKTPSPPPPPPRRITSTRPGYDPTKNPPIIVGKDQIFDSNIPGPHQGKHGGKRTNRKRTNRRRTNRRRTNRKRL